MKRNIPNKITFEKMTDAGFLSCTIEVCTDKSVYVVGDELELVFEFAPDNLAKAVKHMEALGYKRRD